CCLANPPTHRRCEPTGRSAACRLRLSREPGSGCAAQSAEQGGRAMTQLNAQCRLAARPVGLPQPSDWEHVEEPAPEPADGQFLVVSGAAGSVGSVVGQIARIKGARAVGIAGGPAKCEWLVRELGFDAAIDYKAGDLGAALREQTPGRVDVFFDNVGGEILDAVLLRLGRGARVVLSGAISQYNATASMRGPANYMQLLVMRASMAGFVIFDYAQRFHEAAAELAAWLGTGELRSREDVVRGT